MKRLVSFCFNMDAACVDLEYSDGSMIAIDTIAVENDLADNIQLAASMSYIVGMMSLIMQRRSARW